MTFGRNPHIAKAEAAEQKARCASDIDAGKRAWREAARQWDRAADRETDDKRRQAHGERADAARAEADSLDRGTSDAAAVEVPAPAPKRKSMLN